MGRRPQKLELTWFNKDKALIPTETGKYGYTWVDPKDPRYCETHTLIFDESVKGKQAPKEEGRTYSERADLPPTDDNLLILGESGDVLEALTRVPELADKYVGKVKCIYIDPPFNTAQTFANYEDNLEHSIWLTMMRDRLIHLRKLLSEDGSIWVHLDDVENHRMRVLMDEVFGSENYVAEMQWEKTYSPRNDSAGISMATDMILVYRRSAKFSPRRLPRTQDMDSRYQNPDNDPTGRWKRGDSTAPGASTHQGMVYGIQHPLTGEMVYPSRGRCWTFGQEKMLAVMRGWAPYQRGALDAKEIANQSQVVGPQADPSLFSPPLVLVDSSESNGAKQKLEQGAWPIITVSDRPGTGFSRKVYLSQVPGKTPVNLLPLAEVDHTDLASKQIQLLFPDQLPFSTPKPERLLERIIHIATNPGDLVLDIFAGSGTTAAVAQKMGRRWVTCELVEDTMNRFTRPRLEKVVKGEDSGGITLSPGERVAATDDGLPEGLTPDDAQKLTSLLNKAVRENDDLKRSKEIRELKALVKTRKSPETINWRGGGGFRTARLSPSCYDYDPDLGVVLLTPEATGEVLIRSVVANLNFRLTPEHSYFHGVRGAMRLVVIEGRLDHAKVDDLVAHLEPTEGLTIAATEIEDGVRQYIRSLGQGCRAIHVPDDIFSYSEEG